MIDGCFRRDGERRNTEKHSYAFTKVGGETPAKKLLRDRHNVGLFVEGEIRFGVKRWVAQTQLTLSDAAKKSLGIVGMN